MRAVSLVVVGVEMANAAVVTDHTAPVHLFGAVSAHAKGLWVFFIYEWQVDGIDGSVEVVMEAAEGVLVDALPRVSAFLVKMR